MRHIFPLLVIVIALVVAFAGPAPGAEAAAITIDPAREQSVQPALLSEVKKLLASDAQAGARFSATAVSGDTAVVGARLESTVANEAGAAYVFQRDQGGAGNWGEVEKLTASDAQAGDRFGWSMAVSGDTAVVGRQTSGSILAGAAYVFQRDQGGPDNWGEVKKLLASDIEVGDNFGESVAVSGDTAVVGARLESTVANNAGAVYVFQRDQGGPDNWGEVKKLTASDGEAGDFFGASVAVSGSTVAVVAPSDGDAAVNAGAVYVFQRDQGGPDNWGEVKKLLASDAEAGDNLGNSPQRDHSVAVSGDTVIAGAIGEDAGGNYAGAAYVFQRDQGGPDNWGEVKKLLASDAEAGDHFGVSVAVSGDTALVGAIFESTVANEAGAVYVFQRDQGGAGNWGEVEKLTASDAQAVDIFGWSVAVNGGTVVVGAFAEDAGGNNAGAAYVFEDLAPPGVGGIVEIVSGMPDGPQQQSSGSNSSALLWIGLSAGAAALGLGCAVGIWRTRRRRFG